MDVFRTFPLMEVQYCSEFSDNFHSLLYEFSKRDVKMGYYQGFNFIGGTLLFLLGNNIDLSLYYMTKIFSLKSKKYDLCFKEMFLNDFRLARMYMELFHSLLNEHFTGLDGKLKSIGVIDEIWVWKWIMIIFCASANFDLCVKFLDVIIACGIDYLVGISLALVEISCKELEKCEDLMDFNNVMNNGHIKLKNKQKERLFEIIYNDIEINKYNLL